MKKGVIKLAACCMAGVMVMGSFSVNSLAVGLDASLAGMGAAVVEGQKAKEEAGVVKVEPTKYDTIAIAQVDEYVNIRDAASTETGNVVGKLYNNCKAEILGQTDNGWYLIKSGGVTGYVSADYFVTGDAAEELAKEVGNEVATVKEGTETLMVRSSADSSSDAISMVGDSEKLQVLEDAGDWVKVSVDDDVVGYVSKDYVECDTEFREAESVEEVAARQDAIQQAYETALRMQEAAYEAMNMADGDEAAYAASQANAALAEAKMLASEQEFDYEAKELAEQVAAIAQDTTVASVWAQEAQAEYERIAAEEAAAAAAQAEAEAAYLASLQEAQSNSASQEQVAQQKEQEAAEAWQEAVDAQNDANSNWSEEAQAQADAAAQAAMQAAAEAEAARQQAEQAAQEAAQAEAEAAAQQQAQQQETSSDSSSDDTSSSESSGTSSTRQSVVNYALQFVGNPYVYGGNSLTNGIDCSGFTQQILAHFGVSIPRTAESQSGTGTPVSLDNIQPGDLLFYSSGSGIGHVSMYIGNGQVVHASNPTSGIIVSSINYRTPCCARSYF